MLNVTIILFSVIGVRCDLFSTADLVGKEIKCLTWVLIWPRHALKEKLGEHHSSHDALTPVWAGLYFMPAYISIETFGIAHRFEIHGICSGSYEV